MLKVVYNKITVKHKIPNTKGKDKPKSVKISSDTYTKYFREGAKPKEVTETIEKALAYYFENVEGQ